MAGTADRLKTFLAAHPLSALVEVAEAKGSTPREKGAWMLVAPDAIFGTIGGGQLEFMAIDKAREMLLAAPAPQGMPDGALVADRIGDPAERPSGHGGASPAADDAAAVLSIPLGPEIGQCCGGRVEISLRPVGAALAGELAAMAAREDSRMPHVYIFGGGHVGHALAAAFALLPVETVVVETRAEALEGMPSGVLTRLTSVPEEMVVAAPPGSAFVVLTHDHALDFLIVAEALKRKDAAYVGMIGSKTKKATFRSWYLKTAGGTEEAFSRLVSPIGGDALNDKRPAVIAALAAAEIMTAVAEPKV